MLTMNQDNRIMETKVNQLEGRLGNIHTNDIVTNEKNKFLNGEVEQLRQQKAKLALEIQTLKDSEVQNLTKIQELKRQIDTYSEENRHLAEKVMDAENERNNMN